MSKIYKGCTKETETLNPVTDYRNNVCHIPDVNNSETVQNITGSYFDLSFKPTTNSTYKSVFPQILAAISAISFHLPIGFVVAYSAILLPQLADEYKENGDELSSDEKTWIASLSVLVVPIAALVAGILVDSIGRICTLKIASIPYVAGWIFIACSPSLTYVMIGRFLTGFSLAMGTSPAIAYITEIARPDLRGTLICLGPSMTSFGVVLVYIAGWMLHWRTIAWLSIGVVIIPLFLMYMFSPESPTWLISKGRFSHALKSLKVTSQYKEQTIPYRSEYFSESLLMAYKLRRLSAADEHLVLLQVRELERANQIRTGSNEDSIPNRFAHAMLKPSVFKPFAILSMCFLFQQLSGIYILIFYTLNFFEDLKTNINSNGAAVLVGLIRMFVGFVTSQLLYKLGRRLLILSSFTLMAICITISAYFTYLIKYGEYEESWIRVIPIGCLLFYICFSTMGALSVPWTMTAEVYPMEIRGVMQGLTVAVAHLIMFAVLKSYELLRYSFGGSHGLQLFFACVCVLGVFFCALFLPETHKKKLEDITDYFNNNTIYLKARNMSKDTNIPDKNDADNNLLGKV